MTTRRISPSEWRLWDEWRPVARAFADVLERFYGYRIDDDDGAVIEALCAEVGLEPDWTVGYLQFVRRFAGNVLPENKPKRPPWRTATPDDAWRPSA